MVPESQCTWLLVDRLQMLHFCFKFLQSLTSLMFLLISLHRYKLCDTFLHMLAPKCWEREEKIPNPKTFDRKGEEGFSLKKSIKAEGQAAKKADKNTFAVWGYPSFPGLSCDGGFLLPGQAGTAPKCSKGRGSLPSMHSLCRNPDDIRTLLVLSRKRLASFPFPLPNWDYLKNLQCGLTNFNINYVASDLQLLILKLRDPNKLVHFAVRYPSFKQSTFHEPIMDQVKKALCTQQNRRDSTVVLHYGSVYLLFPPSECHALRKEFAISRTYFLLECNMIESFIIQSENVRRRNSILRQTRSLNVSVFIVLIMNIIGSLTEIHFQTHRVPDWSLMGCFGFVWFLYLSGEGMDFFI